MIADRIIALLGVLSVADIVLLTPAERRNFAAPLDGWARTIKALDDPPLCGVLLELRGGRQG